MKRIVLSAGMTLMLSSAAFAETMTLYTDPATGQVFTQAGEGRVEMGDFVSAKEVYLENQEQDSALAAKEAKRKDVDVYAKASKLEFSGTHYLGYKYIQPSDSDADSWSGFETRRNYLQIKAYFFDNPKSYMRVTLDTFQNNTVLIDETGVQYEKQGANDIGSWEVRLKYAYIYLDSILPYTGVEFGQVHRPWIDYEEHQGWWYRSISKTFMEASESADLSNSADLGINFKTKLPYFTSEIGVFNGEGYHQQEMGQGNSFEWRVSAALLGNGDTKRVALKDAYFDISSFGQIQEKSNKVGARNSNVADGYDYRIYGFHTVYNRPSFLLSAQYITSESDAPNNYKQGKGYSANGTYRFGDDKEYDLFGRYDRWDDDKKDSEKEYWIAGAGYQYNKNVKFIANVLNTDEDKKSDNNEYMSYMFSAEVHW